MNREDAEAHWEYTAKVIGECMKIVRVAYIEAMLHGYKHGVQSSEGSTEKGET